MTKISILIPVYNTEKYIRRCLDSLVNQTLKDIEIICIDDCSTDNSHSIIEEYVNTSIDRNIQLITLTKNGGVGRARNFGMKLARGEFIGFVDSDDYVDLGYYEELYKYTTDYDVVRGIRVINEDRYPYRRPYGCIVPSRIRRDFLISNQLHFPETREPGEDSTFKRWLYNKSPRIFECPNNHIYYHYVKRAGSLSNYDIKEDE